MTKLIKMKGRKFGRLLVIDDGERQPNRTRIYTCQCDCGKVTKVDGGNLRSGDSKSCGCFRVEVNRGNEYSLKHGQKHTPEYQAWINLRRRCSDPNDKDFKNYGGRGIEVCSRWNDSFENFYADIGPRPGPGYSVDRIDNNGNYEPGNFRWVTSKEQQNNRRDNVVSVVKGVTYTSIAELARENNIPVSTLRARINYQKLAPDVAVSKSTDRRSIILNGKRKSIREVSTLTGIPASTIHYRLKRGMTIEEVIKNNK